jgi:hypothetical protein
LEGEIEKSVEMIEVLASIDGHIVISEHVEEILGGDSVG